MAKSYLLYICIFIFTSFMFNSCSENTIDSEFPYIAEVIGESLDCKDFEIKIIEGIQKVKIIIGDNSGNIYTAKNLPDSLKIEGLKIKLDIRKIKNSEITACTTLGIPYPWLYVITADKY